jgi:hypothetical protein
MNSYELIKLAGQYGAQKLISQSLDVLPLSPQQREEVEAQMLLAAVVGIEKVLNAKPARDPLRPRGFPGQQQAFNNLFSARSPPVPNPPSYRSRSVPNPRVEAYYGQLEGNANPEGVPPPPYVPRSN